MISRLRAWLTRSGESSLQERRWAIRSKAGKRRSMFCVDHLQLLLIGYSASTAGGNNIFNAKNIEKKQTQRSSRRSSAGGQVIFFPSHKFRLTPPSSLPPFFPPPPPSPLPS